MNPTKEKPVVKAVAVTAVIATLMTHAVMTYSNGRASRERLTLIEGNNNIIVVIGAGAYSPAPEAFAKALATVAATEPEGPRHESD